MHSDTEMSIDISVLCKNHFHTCDAHSVMSLKMKHHLHINILNSFALVVLKCVSYKVHNEDSRTNMYENRKVRIRPFCCDCIYNARSLRLLVVVFFLFKIPKLKWK